MRGLTRLKTALETAAQTPTATNLMFLGFIVLFKAYEYGTETVGSGTLGP